MKKIIVSAVALSTAFLTSCNLNSSDEGNTEVASVEKLPDCNVKGGPSGDGMGGQRMYVEKDKSYYTCTGRGWMLSQVQAEKNLPKCSEKKSPDLLGAVVYAAKDSTYFMCLPNGWVEVDSSAIDPENMDNPVIPDGPKDPDAPAGVSAAYSNMLMVGNASNILGPFVEGTKVFVKEVATNDTVKVSKKISEGRVLGKLGDYTVPITAVYSEYGEVSLNGIYKDPLTKAKSKDSLELSALVSFYSVANGGSVQISIFNHVLSARVLQLMKKENFTYGNAVEQATKELVAAFGYDYDDYSAGPAAIEFAIGLLIKSDLDFKDFVKTLNLVTKNFAKNGTLDMDSEMAAMADFAFDLHNSKLEIGEDLVTESTIRKNLESFGVAAIPAFEFYIQNFYENIYGLGVCGDDSQNEEQANDNKLSKKEVKFKCVNNNWLVIASGDDNGGSNEVDPEESNLSPLETNATLSGRVNVCAPYVEGTKVSLKEIAFDNATNVSAKVHEGTTIGEWGDFTIGGVTYYSPYAELTVKGKYRDLVSTEKSDKSIELRRVVALGNNNFEVNLFKHLQSARMKTLMADGMYINDAESQARQELLAAFGFEPTITETSVEFAINILLQADLDAAEFIKRVDAVTKDFAEKGKVSDNAVIASMADFAFELKHSEYFAANDLRRNFELMNMNEVPSFEQYLNSFYEKAYGLGVCGSGSANDIVKNANKKSKNAKVHFTCDAGSWRVSTDVELDTVGFGSAEQGTLKKGSATGKTYGYDSYNNVWNEANEIDIDLGLACNAGNDGEYKAAEGAYYLCNGGYWKSIDEMEYAVRNEYCETGKTVKYNEKTYVCEGSVWRLASDVEAEHGICNSDIDGRMVECNEKAYVCEGSGWRLASDNEAKFGICNSSTDGHFEQNKEEYFYCGQKNWIYDWYKIDEDSYNLGLLCFSGFYGASDNENVYASFEKEGKSQYRYCKQYAGWIAVDETSFYAKALCDDSHYDFVVKYGQEGVEKWAYCSEPNKWQAIDKVTYYFKGVLGYSCFKISDVSDASYTYDSTPEQFQCGCLDDSEKFTTDPAECATDKVFWNKKD